MIKRKYILPAVLLACGLSATQAQTNEKELTREMLLEKEYTPTILEASRINILPDIREPQLRKTPVEYSNYALPLMLSPQIRALSANQLFTDVKESDKKGYAHLALATTRNIDADLGYRILDGSKDKLDLYFSHRSANDKFMYLQVPEDQKMKINDTWGALAYAHKFEPFRLFTGIKYAYSAFNYYGYNDPFTGVNPPLLDKNINQADRILDLHLGAASYGTGDLNYFARLSFYNFKQKYATSKDMDGPTETSGKFDWDLNYRFSGENKYGLKGYIEGFAYNTSEPQNSAYYSGYKGYGRIAANPYIEFLDDAWKAHIGVKTIFSFNHSTLLTLAPDLAFSVYPSEHSELYLRADGGVTSNSNYALYQINRYVSPERRLADTRTNLDGTFGYKMNAAGNIWFDLYVGYRIDRDAYFFRPDHPNTAFLPTAMAGNVSVADMMNTKLFKMGAQIKYQYQDAFELGIRGQYNSWDVDNFNYTGNLVSSAWNKPDFEMDITAGYKFWFPLRLDVQYHLETGRTAYVKWREELHQMKNINEVSLQATYPINPTVSIYSRVDNLLSQKYDLWYGYRAQETSIVVGATLKF